MKTEIESIAGETPGIAYELIIHRFAGSDASAPSVYIQAGLHADERPGVAAMHYLIPMLEQAEAEGRLQGSLTLVPHANPIGAAQHHYGEHMGRFSTGTRANFNRDFPVPDASGTRHLDHASAPVFAERRLKSRLLELADGCPIVLDLHCDDEAVQYIYAPERLWPDMSDLAACLDAEAAVLWDCGSDRAFEEAIFEQMLARAPNGDLSGHCVTTVELRGQNDVDASLARKDAEGIYRFLQGRGVVANDGKQAPVLSQTFVGKPIRHVEMVLAPVGGTILFHVEPGQRVAAGQVLAEIIVNPGCKGGSVAVLAPQAGYVLTRRIRRFIRMGDNVLKIIGEAAAVAARKGALED
ncbi:succinylglutamate desuccinylase/aspartoacylase family protein [Hoeflea sp. YIM 152468]|uniref:succinylglutamate desuccinylase/aspartoacylase domain-containing protein n=1 Tax=Hoeflea sp. YIM 152468 TaxID=3031759 RepID=UPI0023DBB103|nr:succinylglutamate desuccinylase/aspartoacylase family protein [Hoeflea sp. YIM 152468]MDF1610398.1 succinylglutamate desuccinylase/aspartoacylase family protein [Hoeflea sp. YIM 152468]